MANCDLRAVDAAASRLLGRSGEAPGLPGLRAAVLLAQASTHLWHGRHEDVGFLLDEAPAEARRDGLPSLELEALSMMAFVDSYWSRLNRADEMAQRALLARHPAVAAQWPVPRTDPPPEPAAESAPVLPADLPDPRTLRELTILRFLATSM
jgi:hypothetical protein